MAIYQQVLVLDLSDSDLNSKVIGWSFYDGTQGHFPEDVLRFNDFEKPPYTKGIEALYDAWRLLTMPVIQPILPGKEQQTAYLKFEFTFEKTIEIEK